MWVFWTFDHLIQIAGIADLHEYEWSTIVIGVAEVS